MNNFANVLMHIRILPILLMIPFAQCTPTHMYSLTMVLNVCSLSTTVSPFNLTSILNKNIYRDNLPDMIDVCSQGYRTYRTIIVPYVVDVPCGEGVPKPLNWNNDNTRRTIECNYWEWTSNALNIVKQRSPTLYWQHYDHIMFILPDVDKCNFAGLGVVGPCSGRDCRIWITNIYATQLATYLHEIGHTLGLNHAGFNNSEYGDLSSAMGECCFQRCYNAGNTHYLNWTHPKYSVNILPFRAFSRDVSLKPNEYIMIDTPYDARYFIQYRCPISVKYDNEIIANFSKCINVYHTSFDQPSKTDLVNILCNAMSSWSNSKQHFTITVKNKVNESTVVNVKSIQSHNPGSQTCPNLV